MADDAGSRTLLARLNDQFFGGGWERNGIFALAAFALAAYGAIFLPFLPTSAGTLGIDFSYFLPQLLAGYFWFHENGLLAVPWFTPALCGGVPYFANMQGIYYSVPQALTFAMSPVNAVAATFIVFAACGAGGCYHLLRRTFEANRWSALAGAILFLFNGFYSGHMLIGHLTFHSFMLTPWLVALALIDPKRHRSDPVFGVATLVGGLIVAYMVYSGLVHALTPAVFAAVAIMLIHGMRFGLSARPFLRLAAMGTVGLSLSATKIVAGLELLEQFPRDFLELPGYASLWQTFFIALTATSFAPPVSFSTDWLVNTYWGPDMKASYGNHELDFRLTGIPAFLVVVWFLHQCRRFALRAVSPIPRRNVVAASAIGAILFLPILLNWYVPVWNDVIRSIPILGSSSTLIRWLSIYVLVGAIAAALIIERAPIRPESRPRFAFVIVVAVAIVNLTVDRSFNRASALYSATAIEDAYRAVAVGGPVPTISEIVNPNIPPVRLPTILERNETLISGQSNVQCYEPIFGFEQERYPLGSLRPGPTLGVRDGVLNLKNPACMLFPGENSCRPGDHFKQSEIDAARRFISYRPFPFQMPWWQRLANWTSLVTIAAALMLILGAGLRRVVNRKQPPAGVGSAGGPLAPA